MTYEDVTLGTPMPISEQLKGEGKGEREIKRT